MSITKLHIFEKDTDANASLSGYEYQKLKTLETWLQNGINRSDEQIYCEFEEDIFQRNTESQTARFRQLKLYSSPFSFSSQEIQKALVHFFSLYTKADYLFDNTQFVFEASSRIAREQAGNNGQLLLDWMANQEALPDDLLKKCIQISKDTVTNYYTTEFEAAKGKGKLTEEIEKGHHGVLQLQDEVWERFVKTIRWKFENLSPEQAIDALIAHIEELILKQPKHNIKKEELTTVMAYLLYQVSSKARQADPQNRMLDNRLLETCLLEQGSEMDVWYSKIYNACFNAPAITQFRIGEFYEILSAAQYCRNQAKLYPHAALWKNLLNQYYALEAVNDYHRKKCVYEMVWLTVKPNYDEFTFEGEDLKTLDSELRFYITDIDCLETKDELGQMLNILNILFGLSTMGATPFTIEEAIGLLRAYSAQLENRLGQERNLNTVCYLLEFKGLLNISFHYRADRMPVDTVVKPFYDIISLLTEASQFNLSELAYRINELNANLIALEGEDSEKMNAALEKVLDALQPEVEKRAGKFASAKTHINRGAPYALKSKRKSDLLKALYHFHKAKELYLADETMEGYILAVLNIAQLYSACGLNFAAKYYALTGLWMSINHETGKLLHRIPRAFQFLFMSDFSQGAWMSAIADFNHFLTSYDEFSSTLDDESVAKTLVEMAMLLRITAEIQPALITQFDYMKKAWPQQVAEAIDNFKKDALVEVPDSESVWLLASNVCNDLPFNDLGARRNISWNMLGSTWVVPFETDSDGNAVGEEFAAIIQILLGEIALSETDFHLLKTYVKINVLCGNDYKKPEQRKSNAELTYDLTVRKVTEKDRDAVLNHAQMIASFLLYIFGDISLLPMDEIHKQYEILTRDHALLNKIFTLNAYHRMYAGVFPQAVFERDQRKNYALPPRGAAFPQQSQVMDWPSGLSSKYDAEEAIRMIHKRYDAAERTCLKTIKKHAHEANFIQLVRNSRNAGWLDWQIVWALSNFIVKCKAEAKIKHNTFTSDDEYFDALQKAMNEILKLDEDEFPMAFPPEAFEPEGFKMQLKVFLTSFGTNMGLEIRQSLPNFDAVRDFLNQRFNFNSDDVPDRSFLKDII